MLSHINEFLRLGGPEESGFANGPGLSYKGDHGAVGGFSGVYVQHLHAFYRSNGGYDGVNNGFVPAFTIVGYTFDELFHGLSFNVTLKIRRIPYFGKVCPFTGMKNNCYLCKINRIRGCCFRT
jgi:hypothetical protein